MKTWTEAVIHGYLKPDLPISEEKRQSTVQTLGALACIGLKQDTLEVKFDDLVPPAGTAEERQAALKMLAELVSGALIQDGSDVPVAEVQRPLRTVFGAQHGSTNGEQAEDGPHPMLLKALEDDGSRAGHHSQVELRRAAARGERLGLVELSGDRIRFPHSMLQAYLGSRLIGELVGHGDGEGIPDPGWLDAALENAGREVLTALVMHSRSELGRPLAYTKSWNTVREKLLSAADRSDAKSLDILAAAVEIDSVDRDPAHDEIAREMLKRWRTVAAEDRTVEDAKLNAVARLGDAARKIAERREDFLRRGPDAKELPRPAYDTLFQIGGCEESYPIRLAIAQQIGDGGDAAFDAVGWRPIEAYGDAASNGAVPSDRETRLLSYLTHPLVKCLGDPDSDDPLVCHNVRVMRAWLAPLLFSSTRHRDRRQAAKQNLDAWLALVQRGDDGIPLSLEIGLAQGFKHAANRRPQNRRTRIRTATRRSN